MNLYEINKEIEALLDGEFENQEEAQQKYLELEGAKETKIENTVKWIKKIEGDFETIDNEIKRLQELKKDKQTRIESAKNLLGFVLNNEKYETGLFKISFRKSVKVLVSSAFDNEKYLVVKTTTSPDKKKIKEDIENGILVNGAGLEENYNIQIK